MHSLKGNCLRRIGALLAALALSAPLAHAQAFDLERARQILEPEPEQEQWQNINDLLPNGIEGFLALLETIGLEYPDGSQFDQNCIFNDFSLAGQGSASKPPTSMSDGLRIDPPTVVEFDFIQHHLIQTLAENMNGSVGILVLDDFSEEDTSRDPFVLHQEVFDFEPTYTSHSDIQMYEDEVRAEIAGVEEQHLSHGALVLTHFNNLIRATEQFSGPVINGNTVVWTHNGTGHELILVAQHFGETTTNTRDALQGGIAALRDSGLENSASIVVNMSFAIIPCQTLDAFIANKDKFQFFEDYLLALTVAILASEVTDNPEDMIANLKGALESASANEPFTEEHLFSVMGIDENQRQAFPAFRNEALSVMTNPIQVDDGTSCQPFGTQDGNVTLQDPLLSFICSNDTGATAFVAAAGNFGLSYQMFPAALWEVVGSSASKGNPANGKIFFSNNGEILERGAYFRIQDWTNGTMRTSALYYSGTSFSAPIVSLFVALDMAQNRPTCTYWPLPGLARTTLNNETLKDAVQNCR